MALDVNRILTLYQRCKQWDSLPGPGGLFDQNEKIMALLDVVDNEVAHWRNKRIEDQRSEAMHEEQLRNLRGRRG